MRRLLVGLALALVLAVGCTGDAEGGGGGGGGAGGGARGLGGAGGSAGAAGGSGGAGGLGGAGGSGGRSGLEAGAACNADGECASAACHPDVHLCLASPGGSCDPALGCAAGADGVRHGCPDDGPICRPVGDRDYRSICVDGSDCDRGLCERGRCQLAERCPLRDAGLEVGAGPCIDGVDAAGCEACLDTAEATCAETGCVNEVLRYRDCRTDAAGNFAEFSRQLDFCALEWCVMWGCFRAGSCYPTPCM